MKVLLLENIHENAVKTLRDAGHEVTHLKSALEGDALKAALKDVHVVGIRSVTQLTADVLASAKNLLVAGCFCIGTNQVDLKAAESLAVPVFNSPFSNSRSVAELIIAHIINLSRFIGDQAMRMHKGEWNKSAVNCHEVRGKTVGIVGYGHVGSQVSVLAESMGMRVVFYDVVPKMPLGSSSSCQSLEELLVKADFVTLHVPELPTTVNMIGAAEIAMMKKGSYLLNYSRGTVVDLDAAAAALKSGHLLGGAFDVFPIEPTTRDAKFVSPLQGCPNTLLTPHIGGSTEEAQAAIGFEVALKLDRYLKEGCTLGAVNFPELQVERPANTTRIVNIHTNVPGVLKNLNNVVAGFNVLSQTLRTMDNIGYVILDISNNSELKKDAEELQRQITSLSSSIKTRMMV